MMSPVSNNAEKGRLEFYGGGWVSFLPFAIFLVLIVVTTFFLAPFPMALFGCPPS